MTETYIIHRRPSWAVLGEIKAEIECDPSTPAPIKLGLAVRWAFRHRADLRGAVLRGADLSGADLSGAGLSGAALRGADLSGADLSGADLSGADLSGAALSGADLSDADLSGVALSDADLSGAALSDAALRGADLRGADLRHIKADLWMILTMARAEVPAMAAALREGRVNGSTYSGECSCLIGTLSAAGATGLPHDGSSPAEAWFVPIRPGDTPEGDNEGSFRARMALEWIAEWAACPGVDLGAPPHDQ